MSDVDSDHSLVVSDSSLENPDIEKILLSLQKAAEDAKETGDFLSYSTVLDLYLGDPTRYSNEEREQILGQLLDILSDDHKLVAEIGWDLPAIILPFIDSDYDFKGPIRQAPGVYKVLKIFEELALHGNAKELFLKSNELLSTMKRTESPNITPLHLQKFYGLKFYALAQLIDSCLGSIPTLYPSRFLAMSVTSFINAIYINPITDPESAAFLWKRAYTFARNYTRPPFPKEIDLLDEDLKKLNDDEDYLQRKLLTAFVSGAVSMACRTFQVGYANDFFNQLQTLVPGDTKHTNGFFLEDQVLDRFHTLALSFDMDLTQTVKDFISSSHDLVDILGIGDQSDENVSGILFEGLVVDYQKTFARSLLDNESKSVSDAIFGHLMLFVHSIGPQRNMKKIDFNVHDALAITLRTIVPGMVHPSFVHRGLADLAVFWSWYAIHKGVIEERNLSLELSAIPRNLLLTYFQSLLFVIISSQAFPYFRFVTLTLLTKLLSLAPEDISYGFLIDSLKECPYENLKTALVGVFKELVTKDKATLEDITEAMRQTELKNQQLKRPSAPSLPRRNSKGLFKFITLTDARVKEILDIVQETQERTFVKSGDDIILHSESLSTLIALLNFLILLKRQDMVSHDVIDAIIQSSKEKISKIEKQLSGDLNATSILNSISLFTVTLDRLSDTLKS